MKLKTLLLGSAAAMIAVSGARAADAVVAEPEPVDYVRVCDMYGAGYFYIPGTETCLKFGGKVRADYIYDTAPVAAANVGSFSAVTGLPIVTVTPARNSTGTVAYRAQLDVTAKNETDYGTLTSAISFQGNGGAADGNVAIDNALISLGGFRVGYTDAYWTTAHGYGFAGGLEYGGFYGFDEVTLIDYTFAANGFTATVGASVTASTTAAAESPDFYAGATYSGSWGTVAGTFNHDNLANANAWKVSATITAVESLTVKGWYVGNDAGHSLARGGAGSTWHWGAGASYAIASNANIAAGYTDTSVANTGAFHVGAHWQPVPGLDINPEAVFRENNSELYFLRINRSF